MQDPIGYIYEITCLVNGKTYIGLRHYLNDIGKDWLYYLGSGALIKASVQKYGRDQFTKIKLDEAFTEDELQQLEWKHIQAAKALGKAEYNLFNGVGAGGDTFRRLTPERLAEVKQKQSAGIKRYREAQAEARAKKYRDRYLSFERAYRKDVCEAYHRTNSVKAVSQIFDSPVKWIREILETSKVTVSSLNELSKEQRAQFAGGYRKTAETMLDKPMLNGYSSLAYHDILLEKIDNVLALRLTLSRVELEKQLNVSSQWLTMFFRDHKVPQKTDRLVVTTDCKRCLISKSRKLES